MDELFDHTSYTVQTVMSFVGFEEDKKIPTEKPLETPIKKKKFKNEDYSCELHKIEELN